MHQHQVQCQSTSGWAGACPASPPCPQPLFPAALPPGWVSSRCRTRVFFLFKMCSGSMRSLCSSCLFSAETAAEQFLFPVLSLAEPWSSAPVLLLSSPWLSLLPWCPLPAPIQPPFFLFSPSFSAPIQKKDCKLQSLLLSSLSSN